MVLYMISLSVGCVESFCNCPILVYSPINAHSVNVHMCCCSGYYSLVHNSVYSNAYAMLTTDKRPRPSELVSSDEYDTDDSFGVSARQAVSSSVSKKRLETFATTMQVLENRRQEMPDFINIQGKRVEYETYANCLLKQTLSAFGTLSTLQTQEDKPTNTKTTKTTKKKKKMPKPRSKNTPTKRKVVSDSDSGDELPRKSPRTSRKTKTPRTSSPVSKSAAEAGLDVLNHSMVDFNLSEPEVEVDDDQDEDYKSELEVTDSEGLSHILYRTVITI